MSTQFTIYKSSDIGAPVLNGISGSLLNVFKKCLVDGYGEKSPAGWLMPYSASGAKSTVSDLITHGAFQMASGSKYWMHIIDDGSVGSTPVGREAYITGYRLMTSATGSSPGTGQFPDKEVADLTSPGYLIVRKSLTLDATIRDWILIADDRTMYFFNKSMDGTLSVFNNPSSSYMSTGFGDFYSYIPTDTIHTFIAGQSKTGGDIAGESMFKNNTYYFGSTTADGRGFFVASTVDGQNASILVATERMTFTHTNGRYYSRAVSAGNNELPRYKTGGPLRMHGGVVAVPPYLIVENPSNLDGSSPSYPDTSLNENNPWLTYTSKYYNMFVLRGKLRGLHGWLSDNDYIQDENEFSGSAAKTYRVINGIYSGNTDGSSAIYSVIPVLVETSPTLTQN